MIALTPGALSFPSPVSFGYVTRRAATKAAARRASTDGPVGASLSGRCKLAPEVGLQIDVTLFASKECG
jgi:hypothetical protein